MPLAFLCEDMSVEKSRYETAVLSNSKQFQERFDCSCSRYLGFGYVVFLLGSVRTANYFILNLKNREMIT